VLHGLRKLAEDVINGCGRITETGYNFFDESQP